jgi:anti-sigma factor RsiW
MNCSDVLNNLDDYFSGKLAADQKNAMDEHFAGCEKCRLNLEHSERAEGILSNIPFDEPDVKVRDEFLEYIESEKMKTIHIRPEHSSIFWRRVIPISAAASVAFFILGYIGGSIFSKPTIQEEQFAALQDEVRETKNMMILSMLKQSSASKRIMAVNYSEELDRLEPELIDALFVSLNEDKSENVRLAALEALSRYVGVTDIRQELVKSFEQQTDPIIQISMINMMVNLNEKASVPVFEKLIADENTYESVKNQARQGLKLLL